MTRREIDELTELAVQWGAKGLAWIAVEEDGVRSPIAKFLSERRAVGVAEGAAGRSRAICCCLPRTGASWPPRSWAGCACGWAGKFSPLDPASSLRCGSWTGRCSTVIRTPVSWIGAPPVHGAGGRGHVPLLKTEPERVRAKAYDLVINGYELGGGSIRIHRADVQEMVFDVLGLSKEEARDKFGFLLDAFEYGTPPHGGVAFGFDRLVMLWPVRTTSATSSPFPKTQSASCLLTQAPSPVDPQRSCGSSTSGPTCRYRQPS